MSKADPQLRRWAFTKAIKNIEEDTKDLLEKLKGTKRYVFQEEVGDTGFHHFQGRVSFKQAKRSTEAYATIGAFCRPEHDIKGSTFYCMDKDKRIGKKCYTDRDRKKAYYDPYWDKPSHTPFQQRIIDELKTQTKRKILFVVDPEGCCGKTTLRKHFQHHHDNTIIVPSTFITPEDVMQCVYSSIDESNCSEEFLIILDIPRSVSKNAWKIWLPAIECLKDADAYDKRYQFKRIEFKVPRILVISNNDPPKWGLTNNRFTYLRPCITDKLDEEPIVEILADKSRETGAAL